MLTKVPKTLLKIWLWFVFWANVVLISFAFILIPDVIASMWSYFNIYDHFTHQTTDGFLGCFFISIWAIFLVPIPYFISKMIDDFIRQIILGESYFAQFTLQFMDAAKSNIRSRSLYLFWIIKIYIWTVASFTHVLYWYYHDDYDYDPLARKFVVPACFAIVVLWSLTVCLIIPFRDTSLNFAMIVNQFTQSLMFLVFYSKVLAQPEDYGHHSYFDNILIAAFAIGTSWLGTFIAIFYKLSWHIKALIITIYPYIKFYSIKAYKKLASLMLWIRSKLKRKRRRNRTSTMPTTTNQTSLTLTKPKATHPAALSISKLKINDSLNIASNSNNQSVVQN